MNDLHDTVQFGRYSEMQGAYHLQGNDASTRSQEYWIGVKVYGRIRERSVEGTLSSRGRWGYELRM